MAFLLLSYDGLVHAEDGTILLAEDGTQVQAEDYGSIGGTLRLNPDNDQSIALEDGTDLLAEDGTILVLNSGLGDHLLLAVSEGSFVTFPIIQVDSIGVLVAVDYLTFPLLHVDAFGTLGPIQTVSVTFPLFYVAAVDVVNQPVNVTFPLVRVDAYGFVNVKAGSGLYKMHDGDTHDTIYTAVFNGTTANNAINNPFIQTYLTHDNEENLIHVASMKLRCVGQGILRSTLYTMDSINSQTLQNIALNQTMNREPNVLANLISRRIMLRVYTNNIDEVMDISRIIMYVKPVYTQVPA